MRCDSGFRLRGVSGLQDLLGGLCPKRVGAAVGGWRVLRTIKGHTPEPMFSTARVSVMAASVECAIENQPFSR